MERPDPVAVRNCSSPPQSLDWAGYAAIWLGVLRIMMQASIRGSMPSLTCRVSLPTFPPRTHSAVCQAKRRIPGVTLLPGPARKSGDREETRETEFIACSLGRILGMPAAATVDESRACRYPALHVTTQTWLEGRREKLQERLAKLSGGVAVLKVGLGHAPSREHV